MKKYLRLFLLVVISILVFSSMCYASSIDEVEPNGTFDQAHNIGSWSEYNTVYGSIPSIDDTDIFKFSAYSGDRLAVRLNGIEAGNNFDLYLLNSNFEVIGQSERANNANEIVRYDVPSTGSYYILVIPLSTDGYANDVYYLTFYNRIKTGSYTATLSPTSISRQGSGTLSSTATVNLTNNTAVPTGATVRSVQAQGTISPTLGNTFRQVLNSAENVWHTSNQGGTSFTDITIDDQLPVKTSWSVRFYSLATLKSTWSSPKLNISYEYDQTLSW